MTQFKDFDMSFRAHPITGDLMVKKDVSAIKQSIKNLVLTNYHERLNHRIGSGLNMALFELDSFTTRHMSKTNISQLLKQFESRISVISVDINNTNHNYNINITFTIENSADVESVKILLDRVA